MTAVRHVLQLTSHLFVTARSQGQNPSPSRDSLPNGIIGRGVAGVKRDEDVNRLCVVGSTSDDATHLVDVASLKVEPVKSGAESTRDPLNLLTKRRAKLAAAA